MKKYLFIILLSVICIIPFNVNAIGISSWIHIYKDIPITDSEKQEYLDFIISSDEFRSNKDLYPYYAILYQEKNRYPAQFSISDCFYLIFFETHPEVKDNTAYTLGLYINTTITSPVYSISRDKVITRLNPDPSPNYNVIINWMYNTGTNFNNGIYMLDYWLEDYYLATNLEFITDIDFPTYYSDGSLYHTFPAGTNVFANITDVYLLDEEKEYTIEDILNSEDILYSLSKELIGPLPEEMQFMYSIVSLLIGIVVLIVIISPIVLLIRWLM